MGITKQDMLEKHSKETCEECGDGGELHVIDGQLLCFNCAVSNSKEDSDVSQFNV